MNPRSTSLALIFCFFSFSCVAQGNEQIVMAKAIKASGTVGVVEDSNGAAIRDAEVIQFDCGLGSFKGVRRAAALITTRTKADGSFTLNWPDTKVVCLQVETPGMDTLQVKVMQSSSAHKLHLKLTPGT